VDLVLLAGAGSAWGFAVTHTDVHRVGDLGLLAAVHPLYFVAPVLCIAGYVAELLRGALRPPVLVAYLVMVMLVIHATAPLMLDQPRYAWTYRHVGVVELISARGTVSAPDDIYQRWPAFLTGVAQFATVTGVDPLALAPWIPVFFNAVASVLLFAIARALSEERRTAYLTVLLFQCLNWIEQDYLAPQGLAFVLSLALTLVVVRWLRPEPSRSRPWAWLHAGLPTPVDGRGPTRRLAALGALGVIMVALAASHPLSPFLVAGSVVALVALGLVRPWWTAAIVLAIPLLYLAPRLPVAGGSFNLFDGFDLFHNTAGDAGSWGSRGQAVSALTVRTLALVVWFLALLAAFRDRRAIGRVLTPLTFAFLPVGLVLALDHGGEAIYHVYLASAPWCAFLIADMACQLRWPRAVRAPLAVLMISAMLFATVQGRHGQLAVDRQLPTEVAASRYLYTYGRPGAAIILAAPNFPARVTATYDRFNPGLAYDPDLVTGAGLTGVMLGDAYLPLVERFVGSYPGPTRYLVISDGMRRYAEYFGALPAGSLDRLDESLGAARRWTVFYRNEDVVIYELDG
jgi:hypothetical protein